VPKLPRLSLTRAAILVAAVVVGYFIFTAVGDALLSQRLNRDEEQFQQEIVDLQRQQAELEAIREYLQTDEYIEGVARRVLGLVRPGETLVIVSSNPAPTAAPETQPDEEEYRTWWEKLYGP
jgi:cell division protein FtsB